MKTNGHQDRLPPHSLEAEQAVLGCIFLDPEVWMPVCIEKLKSSEPMYDVRHRTIYDNVLAMYDQRIPVDLLTISTRLRDNGQLEKVGGIAYLSGLPDVTPSAANLEYYVTIVQEKYRLRRILQIATGVVSQVYNTAETSDAEDIIDVAEKALLGMSEGLKVQELPKMNALMGRAIETIEHLHLNQGILTGIPTGFIDFDKMTGGLQPGEMIVIAARPSMGKTSLAMNVAEHVAVDQKLPVGIFSLEMTADSLALRMLCARARVNLRTVRDGFLADRDFPRLTNAACKLSAAPLHVDDASALSVFQLRAKARRMASQFGIKLFIVDYMQLLHSTNRKADNRQQEIADISGGIKSLAKELKVPIIALSQLNREADREGKKRPRLADLRESGAIEQDADVVGLLYKTKEDGEDEGAPMGECTPINLLIAKQRNGPTGEILLTFLRSYTRFESAARVAQEGNLPYVD